MFYQFKFFELRMGFKLCKSYRGACSFYRCKIDLYPIAFFFAVFQL